MSKDNESGSSVRRAGGSGLSFAGVLTIVFIVLKLVGVISWNWFWVLSPLIFSVGLAILIIVGALLFIGVLAVIAKMLER